MIPKFQIVKDTKTIRQFSFETKCLGGGKSDRLVRGKLLLQSIGQRITGVKSELFFFGKAERRKLQVHNMILFLCFMCRLVFYALLLLGCDKGGS